MLNRFCDVPIVANRSADAPLMLNRWRDVPINDKRVVTIAGFTASNTNTFAQTLAPPLSWKTLPKTEAIRSPPQ